MTRKEVIDLIKILPNNNILMTLPTSFGKSKCAIERLKVLEKKNKWGIKNPPNILIVIPRLVLINNWKDELKKWGFDKYQIQYTTYISLYKHVDTTWDVCIMDEGHHLSERCRENIPHFNIKNTLILSATIKRELRYELKSLFTNLYHINVSARQAIDDNILPDPKVYLIPLELDDIIPNQTIIKNPKAKGAIIKCTYAGRWQYKSNKYNPIHISCTQTQYLEDLVRQIEYFKQRRGNTICKNLWLKLCGDRLKYLSKCKESFIKKVLLKCKKERTLTFCSNIAQTELLGKYCINSKNKQASLYLEQFNKGTINHITACEMLNEGINLVNCRIGIYAVLNSSEIMILQKLGRLLRHKEPILIIPYYKGTREEEIINKMTENYNKDLIYIINDLNKIVI